ncbi:MocE family 2Fe-2S type ferredoxin [Hoeflea sp. TYP-13]|uniref:MocE family 2Fe-2S type ferredoxin n=1 Tax=Hoeflea sp. TYP-13 TaxID=3230023 RepID=UPI0034C68EF8
MSNWIHVCATDEIDEEDLIRWDHEGRTFAIYNTDDGFFATDGYCTHEQQHLEEGLVIGKVIECPLHQGRFEIATGRALNPPACIDLKTFPVKVEAGDIYIAL